MWWGSDEKITILNEASHLTQLRFSRIIILCQLANSEIKSSEVKKKKTIFFQTSEGVGKVDSNTL